MKIRDHKAGLALLQLLKLMPALIKILKIMIRENRR